MRRLAVVLLLAAGVGLWLPAPMAGQEVSEFLSVGEMAPDFEVEGATRHGSLSVPVKLSDLRGETVVLAFFFKVRTGG